MIDVFPTLESPTNITLNAHVGIPCPFVSRSAIVFSRTIIKENTTIIYLIAEYFNYSIIQKILIQMSPFVPKIGGWSSQRGSEEKEFVRFLSFNILFFIPAPLRGFSFFISFAKFSSMARFSTMSDLKAEIIYVEIHFSPYYQMLVIIIETKKK